MSFGENLAFPRVYLSPNLSKKLEKPQFGPYTTYTFHETDILTYQNVQSHSGPNWVFLRNYNLKNWLDNEKKLNS